MRAILLLAFLLVGACASPRLVPPRDPVEVEEVRSLSRLPHIVCGTSAVSCPGGT